MHFASSLDPVVVMISTMRDFACLIKPNQVLGDHHIMENKSILNKSGLIFIVKIGEDFLQSSTKKLRKTVLQSFATLGVSLKAKVFLET